MFSFRTTPLENQLDKALRDGRVGVFASPAGWDPQRGYTWDIFSSRGNLAELMLPQGELEAHIDFDWEKLAALDAIVVEIQDTGSRHFRYTGDVLRLMSALATLPSAPPLYIVDRPNPLGRAVEGTLPAGESDVFLPKVAHRHGLTLGELCLLYYDETGATYPLHVVSADCSSSGRSLMSWAVPPAADIPGLFSAIMYTGGVLWTDTSLNPGLGTGRPYEYIGAPFLKPSAAVPPAPEGVLMRPCSFIPGEGLYAGERCFGYQILLTPEVQYKSLGHTLALMRFFAERYSQFSIGDALYTRLADPVMTEFLKGSIGADIVEEHIKSEEQKWVRKARRFLLYDEAPYRIK